MGIEMLAISEKATAAIGQPEDWEARPPVALVASGHAETLRWGTKWLERLGFHVRTAQRHDEAALLLRAGDVEIVIADASMRPPDGLGTWAALRHLVGGGELPLLALCSSDRECRRALLEGSTDVVRKPLEWPLLSQRAARLVQAHRTWTELARARGELEGRQGPRGAEDETGHSASLDPLTGLPLRRAYETILDGTLSGNVRTGSELAVLFLDLDRFKLVNETYGRRAGSQVLLQVAERLGACLRRRDLVLRTRSGLVTAAMGRLGGDAFSVMVSPVGSREEVLMIATTVLDALSAPFALGDTEVYLSASVGIALAPTDGGCAEELLQRAELAMVESRRRGGGLSRFYSRALSDARERALKIDRLLRKTLDRNELSLHYQPLIDARSQRIVGAEALLRWQHPELGNVPPMEFIPFAEETGFMVEIGRWVLRTACRQLREWLDDGLPTIRMATNVSLCQLVRGNLPQLVDQALEEAGLDPSLLELELSERGVLRSDPDILRQLQALRSRGVRISVDDFGTGDSAIAYLKRFPLDTLKVDQSFVKGSSTDPDDAAITSAMVAMAHRLRMRVVAEGVETSQQLDLLQDLGCEEVQGFLFSPAAPPAAFRELLGRDGRVPTQDVVTEPPDSEVHN
jgi:diguanylate cyclase (GGDEF)-like protein